MISEYNSDVIAVWNVIRWRLMLSGVFPTSFSSCRLLCCSYACAREASRRGVGHTDVQQGRLHAVCMRECDPNTLICPSLNQCVPITSLSWFYTTISFKPPKPVPYTPRLREHQLWCRTKHRWQLLHHRARNTGSGGLCVILWYF